MDRGEVRDRTAALIVAGLAVLPWLPALFGDFVWDDRWVVVENPKLALIDLPGWWTEGEARFSAIGRPGRYNPLGWTIFLLESVVAGPTRPPWIYHLTSLAVHAGVATLVFLILRRLVTDQRLAGLLALVFAWHPAQSEVACWPSARFESEALLLVLAGGLVAHGARGHGRAFLGGFLASAALFCKETAGPIALLVPLAVGRRLATAAGVATGVGTYFTIRAFADVGAPSQLGEIPVLRIAAGVLELHRLAWLPTEQSLMRPIPLAPAPLAIGVAVIVLLAAIAVRRRSVWFGLIWAGGVLGVHALAAARYELLPDRYLYLAMPGLLLLLPPLVERYRALRAALVAALVLFAATDLLQTRRWSGDVELFGWEAAVWPEAPQARYQHGLALGRAGDLIGAEAELTEAVRLGPSLPQTWGELAALQANAGRIDAARATVERGLAAIPGNPALLNLRADLADR